MTWGRKEHAGRREPLFGLAASLSELRLSPQDRVTPADDDKPAKKIPKRKAADPDEDAPRERKPRVSRGGSKRKGRARGGIARLFYWGAVLGLWAAIAVVGVLVWVGAHLPGIQALRKPNRPPPTEITAL